MDKRLLKILEKIQFDTRFIQLYNKNKDLEENTQIKLIDFEEALKTLDFDVTYNKREKFFKHVSHEQDYLFQLNIVFKDTFIEYIFFTQNESIKLKAGGPFGVLVKKLDKKVKRIGNISHNSIETLNESLSTGISLFREIKQELLETK